MGSLKHHCRSIRSIRADQINERLGDEGAVWPAQRGQRLYNVMVCRTDRAAAHPATMAKFSRSLGEAEGYLPGHPAEAEAIVQRRLNHTNSCMATVRSKDQLSCDRSPVIAMEDGTQWVIANSPTNATAIPGWGNSISTNGIETVKQESDADHSAAGGVMKKTSGARL